MVFFSLELASDLNSKPSKTYSKSDFKKSTLLTPRCRSTGNLSLFTKTFTFRVAFHSHCNPVSCYYDLDFVGEEAVGQERLNHSTGGWQSQTLKWLHRFDFLDASLSTQFLILLMEKLSNCLPVSSSISLQDREFWPRVGARPGTMLSALHPFGCSHVHQWNVSRSVLCQKQMCLYTLLLSYPLACVAVWGILERHMLKMAELLTQGP